MCVCTHRHTHLSLADAVLALAKNRLANLDRMAKEVPTIDLFGVSDVAASELPHGSGRGSAARTPAPLGDDDDGFGFDFDPTASLSSLSSADTACAAGAPRARALRTKDASGEALWGGPQSKVRAALMWYRVRGAE